MVVAPDDFLIGGFPAAVVIDNTVACHIYAHIRRGFIWAFSQNLFENSVEYRENLHIPVIVHCGFPISFQVERIDHVYIVEIGSCRFIGHIHRMLQRKVPDGEGFELGISCLNPSLMLMIQLGKTGSHFAAAGSGSGYDNEGPGSFHILIPAIAFIADDKINIIGIAFDHIMKEGTDSQIIQPQTVLIRRRLSGILGDNNGISQKAHFSEGFNQAKDFRVIGETGIHADFIPFNRRCTDDKNYFSLFSQLVKHFKFTVRLKTGKNPGGVVVVKKLASEFQIKFIAEHGDAVPDML